MVELQKIYLVELLKEIGLPFLEGFQVVLHVEFLAELIKQFWVELLF